MRKRYRQGRRDSGSPISSSLLNRSSNAPSTRTKHGMRSICIGSVLVAGLVGRRSQGEHPSRRRLYLGIIRHSHSTVAVQSTLHQNAFSTTEFLIAIRTPCASWRICLSLYRCSFSPTRNEPPLAITWSLLSPLSSSKCLYVQADCRSSM